MMTVNLNIVYTFLCISSLLYVTIIDIVIAYIVFVFTYSVRLVTLFGCM